MRFIDALFEATSGLTTTGATILTGLDDLPHSILYYRQQLQWLGGMGIIVLAVAVMPTLGVGGMQLYRAETPGPMKDKKLTPRITETAKAIWYIYLGLTIVCGVLYFIAGMSPFDALCHAFSTVAIGGFSTHDASLGYFQNDAIYLVAGVFMVLAGLNFALHFSAVRCMRIRTYLTDPEARVYFSILLGAVFLTVFMLVNQNQSVEGRSFGFRQSGYSRCSSGCFHCYDHWFHSVRIPPMAKFYSDPAYCSQHRRRLCRLHCRGYEDYSYNALVPSGHTRNFTARPSERTDTN